MTTAADYIDGQSVRAPVARAIYVHQVAKNALSATIASALLFANESWGYRSIDLS
jgi:hypothetical protein